MPRRQGSVWAVAMDDADPAPASIARSAQGGRLDRAPVDRATSVVNELDARHGRELFGLAHRSGLGDDTAQDAVQEALLRLWLEVRSGVEIIDPRAWTFRTLYRIAMDHHRVRRRAIELVDRLTRSVGRVEPPPPSTRSIWELVDTLPTRQRQVLYLHYKADMTYEQTAAVMGITASAARAHAAFASVRLRAALGAGWDD
jgi:RNA polymerase sigma factor (sigma-70 family)